MGYKFKFPRDHACRVARSSFTAEQCAQNLEKALEQAVSHLPKGWKGIRACFLKTADSVALPIFQRLPDDEGILKIAEES